MVAATGLYEMSDKPGDEEAKVLAELKEWGENNVRRLLGPPNQLSSTHCEPARKWIEEIDRASAEEIERRKDASVVEQIEIDRSAKDAAWAATRAAERAAMAAEKANIRATIALVIAAISVATTITLNAGLLSRILPAPSLLDDAW